MGMKSVMIVINSLSGGGAERSMNILASLLLDKGISIELVAVNNGRPDYFMPNCPVHILGRNWKGGIFSTLASANKLRKIATDFQPDVSILNCELPELLWLIAPRNFKYFIVEHTSKPWNNRKALGLFVRKILDHRTSGWISVSSDNPIWPIGRKPFRVIPNPIMLPQSVESLEAGLYQMNPRLVFLGRLDKVKNPQLFIDICAATGISGVIIGSGPMENDLKEMILLENLPIKMLGYKDNPWRNISKNDILLVTSNYEGDGMVVLEALQFGVNIIAIDNPDLRRIGLPEKNYAKSVTEFKRRILGHLDGKTPLSVDVETTSRILAPRNLNVITKSWLEII